MEPTPVAAAMATYEAALARLLDACRDELWRSGDGEVADVVERLHRSRGQLESGYLSTVWPSSPTAASPRPPVA